MSRTNRFFKTMVRTPCFEQWVASRLRRHNKFEHAVFVNQKMFLEIIIDLPIGFLINNIISLSVVPIHNFPRGTGSWWIGTRESPCYKLHFFEISPTVVIPSTFSFANFIFQVPERYAYLSGTGKLKCIDQNFTRTCLVQMIKWKQELGNFTSRRKSSGFWND